VKEDVARDLEKFSRDINNVKETVDKQLVKVSEMAQGQEGWREVVKKRQQFDGNSDGGYASGAEYIN